MKQNHRQRCVPTLKRKFKKNAHFISLLELRYKFFVFKENERDRYDVETTSDQRRCDIMTSLRHLSCADPESFVRGGPTLTNFFKFDEGTGTIQILLLCGNLVIFHKKHLQPTNGL